MDKGWWSKLPKHIKWYTITFSFCKRQEIKPSDPEKPHQNKKRKDQQGLSINPGFVILMRLGAHKGSKQCGSCFQYMFQAPGFWMSFEAHYPTSSGKSILKKQTQFNLQKEKGELSTTFKTQPESISQIFNFQNSAQIQKKKNFWPTLAQSRWIKSLP